MDRFKCMDKSEIISLFELYQFELVDQTKEYLVFSASTSMYPIVEIVLLAGQDAKLEERLRNDYSKAGFGVFFRTEKSIKALEDYLFDRAFNIQESNFRSQQAYKNYTNEIIDSYRDEDNSAPVYKYIDMPYTLERDFEADREDKSIVDSIIDTVNSSGPMLIIIEASAGYGKTSTAYEILNRFSSQGSDKRPFFMELYRDRVVKKFHYVMLSQIARTFKVLQKPDLVIHNIRTGRIPLIIDGFDELLSADIDNGNMEADFSEVSGMLSTIADLLKDEAKIILTSRKTAIFAGEAFYDWYAKLSDKGQVFKVFRYALGTPSVEMWLGEERTRRLPSSFNYIINPVLLSYLKNISDDKFSTIIDETKLSQTYFDDLLKRERIRQDLPFSAAEQEVILRRLSAYFAGLNISSLKRADIKDVIGDLSEDIISTNINEEKDFAILTNALTNHVFLDRKTDSNIGFLNDFIFGTFFMKSLLYEDDSFYDDYFKGAKYGAIEKLISAASVWGKDIKARTWEVMNDKCEMTEILRFWSDMILTGEGHKDYTEISPDGKIISNAVIGSEKCTISKSCFSNVIFNKCIFDANYLDDYLFVNCEFNECEKIGAFDPNAFYSCKNETFLLDAQVEQEDEEIESLDIYVQIIGKYYQVGGQKTRLNLISRISKEFDIKAFRKAFKYLVNKGYIYANGDKSFLMQAGSDYYREHCLKN